MGGSFVQRRRAQVLATGGLGLNHDASVTYERCDPVQVIHLSKPQFLHMLNRNNEYKLLKLYALNMTKNIKCLTGSDIW